MIALIFIILCRQSLDVHVSVTFNANGFSLSYGPFNVLTPHSFPNCFPSSITQIFILPCKNHKYKAKLCLMLQHSTKIDCLAYLYDCKAVAKVREFIKVSREIWKNVKNSICFFYSCLFYLDDLTTYSFRLTIP